MFFIIVILLLLVVGIITVCEYRRNARISKLPARPSSKNSNDGFDKIMNSNLHEVLFNIENGIELDTEDFSKIQSACQYLDYRYDCLDFRMQTIIRILFKYSDKVPKKYIDMMKSALLGSKYFMDQPGEDSICFWSENHQILFAASEYLTGQLYEDEVFTNDGLSGKKHKEIALKRINIWLRQRFYYGFTEWYSNTYYEEDIAPLANLIDFCDDPTVVVRSKMVLDLLLYDIAAQSHKGSFTSTSGRQYEMGKKSGEHSALRNVTKHIWAIDVAMEKKGLDLNFIFMDNYRVPAVIRKIGYDKSSRVIKASCGLNLKELVNEMPKRQSLERVMMQWAMESFSNSEVVADTVFYIHKNKMLSNEFLNDFKIINLTILKYTGLLPLLVKILRPFTNGVAIQRANTYTYKTNNYMLSTAQKYHPGDFGDQQHIWSATLAPNLCVFTTHPAPAFTEDGALSASPSYWVGNGRNPHSVQDRNINISIYSIEGKKGFMEKELRMYTHCYFPRKLFDEHEVEDRFAAARAGDAFIAVLSGKKLLVSDDELIQEGALTFWVTELSSADEESFKDFKKRIKENYLSFNESKKSVNYSTLGRQYCLAYKGDFKLNGNAIDLDYKRFDSKYSVTDRKSPIICIKHEDESLVLDYENGIREVGG